MYLQKKGLLLERGETTERRAVAGCDAVTKLLPKIALTILILTGFAAVVSPGDVRAQRSLHYEPEVVALEGRLVVQSRYGPPNYGEQPKTDQKVKVPVLVLKSPVNVLPIRDDGINTKPVYGARQIQLAFPVGDTGHKKLIGKTVVVKGTLFRAHTGHHYTDVVLKVSSIEKK